jgi:peptidoglycan/xylan/chitin deacetylase (PgdA/CDA1 family)
MRPATGKNAPHRLTLTGLNMTRTKLFMLLAVFFMANNIVYCGNVAAPYEVGLWPGFRSAAVTYTFDDGCAKQYTVALPMFDEFGFKMTLYPVINWGPNWPVLQKAAEQGHEIGSHTVTHTKNPNKMTPEQQETELTKSQDAINSHITGQKCLTIAYPYCQPLDKALTTKYYIAARHCQGFIEPNTPRNFYQISSIMCGSGGSVKTPADFNARFEKAAAKKGWCVFLLHSIDDDGGASPVSSEVLRAGLEYLKAHKDTLWVATFVNVVRYIRERNDVSVEETSHSDNSIILKVTDTLDNEIYNYPLTLRRPLPDGWTGAKISQNGHSADATVAEIESNKYIMFDIIPDGGEVVLTKSTGQQH